MRPHLLCRERLNRIQQILDRAGAQGVTLREFVRTYSFRKWELEHAAEQGWIEIATRRPRTGRPSRVVNAGISKPQPQNYPPWRAEIPRGISARHWQFALRCAGIMPGGPFGYRMASAVWAYSQTFHHARSRAGAAASASRLRNHPDVVAVRAWLTCEAQGTLPRGEPMPDTARGIWSRLVELGAATVTWTTLCEWRTGGEMTWQGMMP